MDLHLNTLQTIDMSERITDLTRLNTYLQKEGRVDIIEFIADARKTKPEYGWDFWKVEKGQGPVPGKWTLRLQKAWKAAKGTPLDKTLLSMIGECASTATHPGLMYLEISDAIDWKSGDFGDPGSCWFDTTHSSYKFRCKFLASGRGYALKFFASEAAYKENRLKGIGRAWVAVQDGRCFIFNGKGQVNNMTVAKALSIALHTDHSIVNFSLAGHYLDSGDRVCVGPLPHPHNTVLAFDPPPAAKPAEKPVEKPVAVPAVKPAAKPVAKPVVDYDVP